MTSEKDQPSARRARHTLPPSPQGWPSLSWPQGGGLDSGERRNTVGVKVVVPALSAQRVLGLPSPGLKALTTDNYNVMSYLPR